MALLNQRCAPRIDHCVPYREGYSIWVVHCVPHREGYSIWVVHCVPHREGYSIWVVHCVPHREGYSIWVVHVVPHREGYSIWVVHVVPHREGYSIGTSSGIYIVNLWPSCFISWGKWTGIQRTLDNSNCRWPPKKLWKVWVMSYALPLL